MSAERFRGAAWVLLYGLVVAVPVGVADELPDLELLEYLGSWRGSDLDWILLQDAGTEHPETDPDRSDSPSPGRELSDERLPESENEN